jgi:hypothetical protein
MAEQQQMEVASPSRPLTTVPHTQPLTILSGDGALVQDTILIPLAVVADLARIASPSAVVHNEKQQP